MRRRFHPLSLVPAIASLLIASLAGCTADLGSTASKVLTASLSASTIIVAQDGTPATLGVNVSGISGSATVSVSGLPAGVTSQFTPVNGGPSGTLTFIGGAAVPPGSSAASVTVTTSSQAQSLGFTVISGIVAKVGTAADTSLGTSGYLNQFMSTSFQIAGFTGDYFGSGATKTARQTTLNSLAPQHIRLQAIGTGVPMTANTGTAADWDFTILDRTVQPVLESADRSPEFQIAVAPTWMLDANGNLDTIHHLNDFATYAANLVRYYNKGGFTWGGHTFASASSQPIKWWGIFNEPNLKGLTPQQYVTLYNTVVPAMLAVDTTIKFSALELSDYGLGTGQAGDPERYLPIFLAPASSGGISAQIDSISTHLYSSCNQLDTDNALFSSVSQFVANIQYFSQQLAKRADLAQVPIWVTENNVNADYQDSNGKSNCNPGQTYVVDTRGSSPFFAAWRPYVFSQLGKAGNHALYQWMHSSSAQYGEVDLSGTPYLSYWVDRALQNAYPVSASGVGTQILKTTVNDPTSSVEVLATKNASGVVTVMIVDRAVHAAADNNGTGDPRLVVVDLTSFSSFKSASGLIIDASTNLTTGPTAVATTVSDRIPVMLSGYGVAFLTLTP